MNHRKQTAIKIIIALNDYNNKINENCGDRIELMKSLVELVISNNTFFALSVVPKWKSFKPNKLITKYSKNTSKHKL